jgi:hypothetical protein
MPLNFADPPKLSPLDQSAVDEMNRSTLTAAQRIIEHMENCCRDALMRHLGRIPCSDEITAHGKKVVSPDGAILIYWDKDLILSMPPLWKPHYTPTI